jgi:hypothetical protein
MELSGVTVTNEFEMSFLPGSLNASGIAIGDGFDMDGVSVLMVEDKDVVIAATEGSRKFASLIGIIFDEFFTGKEHSAELMGARGKRRGKVVVKIKDVRQGSRRRENNRKLGRAEVFGFLILMAKGSGNTGWQMFAD